MQTSGGSGWRFDAEKGHKVPPDHWEVFADWLVMPRHLRIPRTQQELADQLNVHVDSLTRIKRDDRFRKMLESRSQDMNLDPERIQEVINAMQAKAADGDVKAAQVFLGYVEQLKPVAKRLVKAKELADLTDEELQAELAKRLA